MRIGVELRQIVPAACGGIVPLLVGVLRAAFRDYPQHEFHLFCTDANVNLFADPPSNVVRDVLPLDRYYALLDHLAHQRRLDVLLRSFPMKSPLTYPGSRQIVLIPDLQHEAWPDFFTPDILRARRENFKSALAEAAAIGTISEHARGTILAHPDTRCRDVFLMPPALVSVPQVSIDQLTAEEQAAIPRGDYFLYPGNLWPHKNHRRTLEAFQVFLEQSGRRVELVLTGHPDGWPRLAADFPGLPVRHLGFVRRELLQVLLGRARALLFFSLFEGFGMPLLEAFDVGTPVLCSNTTSLPEVGGDAVLTCDPTDVAAMSGLMRRILDEAGLRERLTTAGRLRLPCYDWNTSARDFMEACDRVARNAPPLRSPAILIPRLRRLKARVSTAVRTRVRKLRQQIVNRLRMWRQRLKQMLRSRLGTHHQYPPKALTLPRRREVSLPSPPPRISIVTPSFNQAPFLERTMRSVLDQLYPRLEYIVQDGGSTDGTVDLLKRYGDQFTHWESRRDGGQTIAINLGFRHTTGDIMAYLNSDDVLLPGSLAFVARYFHDHPDVDVIYSHRLIIDPEDREVGRWVLPPHDDGVLAWNDYVPQETLFWRRRVWDRIGGALDESFHFAMDWDLLLRLRDAGARFVRVPRFLAAFRVHPQQKTSSRMVDLGSAEIARLRLRTLGRAVTEDEVQRQVRPYLRRHVMLRVLHRLGLSA